MHTIWCQEVNLTTPVVRLGTETWCALTVKHLEHWQTDQRSPGSHLRIAARSVCNRDQDSWSKMIGENLPWGLDRSLPRLFPSFGRLLLQGSKDKNLATPPSLIGWLPHNYIQARAKVSHTLRGNPVKWSGHIHVQLLLTMHILLLRESSDFTVRV